MFRIIEQGRWQRDQVVMRWTASTWRDEPAVRETIDGAWREGIAKLGQRLFDGPMCRLESLRRQDDRLLIDLSRTSYKIFYGTNLMHPELADSHGADVLANAVGMSVGLISADNHVLLGRRNSSVAYYPDRVHPFAGTLEPDDQLDAFSAALRELNEELRLEEDQIDKMELVAVVEDVALRQPELVFVARSSLNCGQIASQLQPAEHAALWSTRLAKVTDASTDPLLTPVACATLTLISQVT